MNQKPGEVKTEKQRTLQQNRALHKLFGMISEQLNLAGLDVRMVLKPGIEISWTPDMVKEYLWRPIQKAMLNKTSTTELTTKEIDEAFAPLKHHLAEKFGIEQEFPSLESIINNPENYGS